MSVCCPYDLAMSGLKANGFADGRPAAGPRNRLDVRFFLSASLIFLIIQDSLKDYPGAGAAPHVFSLALGCVLLWLVYRMRSGAARVIFMFLACFGAVVYATGIGTSADALTLSLLYLGQALPLTSRPVRQHVAEMR